MGCEMTPIWGAFSGDISVVFWVHFCDHILNQFCGCFGSIRGVDFDHLLKVSKLMGRVLARRRNMQKPLENQLVFLLFEDWGMLTTC